LRPTRIRDLKMKKLVLALICGVLLTSCDKEANVDGIESAFSGTFSVTYLPDEPMYNGTLALELRKNGQYSILGLLHNQSEFSGDYSMSDNKITFDVKFWKTDYFDENGMTVVFNFDTFIVPQGEYIYTFVGNKLKFSRTYNDFNRKYEWEFVKK